MKNIFEIMKEYGLEVPEEWEGREIYSPSTLFYFPRAKKYEKNKGQERKKIV